MQKDWRVEPILHLKELQMISSPSIVDNDSNKIKSFYSEAVFFEELHFEKYWKNALFWYRKAALQDEPLALQMLQCIKDFQKVKRKAIAGDKDAQFRLSVYYSDSYGTKMDLFESSRWLKIAALNGSKDAIECVNDWNHSRKSKQNLTDDDFFVLPGLEPDDYEHFLMINRHGRINKKYLGMARLTGLWKKITKLKFANTRKLAEAGNPEKQYQLAWLYDWGIGVEQDMKTAIKWFVKSAYNQYAPAQTELGIIYHYGIMATTYQVETFDGTS